MFTKYSGVNIYHHRRYYNLYVPTQIIWRSNVKLIWIIVGFGEKNLRGDFYFREKLNTLLTSCLHEVYISLSSEWQHLSDIFRHSFFYRRHY